MLRGEAGGHAAHRSSGTGGLLRRAQACQAHQVPFSSLVRVVAFHRLRMAGSVLSPAGRTPWSAPVGAGSGGWQVCSLPHATQGTAGQQPGQGAPSERTVHVGVDGARVLQLKLLGGAHAVVVAGVDAPGAGGVAHVLVCGARAGARLCAEHHALRACEERKLRMTDATAGPSPFFTYPCQQAHLA